MAERFGVPSPEGVRITLQLSQRELASWTGSSHKATSLALRMLRERGCIETYRRQLIVRDLDLLRQRVG